MMHLDIVTAIFVVLSGIIAILNCRAILRDKAVAGVSIWGGYIYFLWGVWNMFYLGMLEYTWSAWAFIGNCITLLATTIWISLLLTYRRKTPNP